MLKLQNIGYSHPNKDLLFQNIHLSVNNHDKISLIGENGSGKSTLLKIIAGTLKPDTGTVNVSEKPFYIPQIFGQFDELTIAEALNIDKKLNALKEILKGKVTVTNMELLNDDWQIEEQCIKSLKHWRLSNINFNTKLSSLSGGEKTKVFLASILIHKPKFILLDEPSNHLDYQSRRLLYNFIESTKETMIIVSHDRKLLSLLNQVCELTTNDIKVYGGNYNFYCEQKGIHNNAIIERIKSKEKELKKAKELERKSLERQHKSDARGKKQGKKTGLPKVAINALKNSAEKSTSKAKDIHTDKVDSIKLGLQKIKNNLQIDSLMKFNFNNSSLHQGKILVEAKNINFAYYKKLWNKDLNLTITSGKRIAIKGSNSSGKTTLVKIILGKLEPKSGKIKRAIDKVVYIDQNYSLINNQLSIYEQTQEFNTTCLLEHEVKIRLNRFLFPQNTWDKSCANLSGGEKMRLVLCCLNISNQAPDIIVLDEPTNNLDIKNIEILTNAINNYDGTLIAISHDEIFLEEIGIEDAIDLDELNQK